MKYGQKVNLDKSRVWFSPNTLYRLGHNIAREFGIPQTKDIGSYLRVPLMHGRAVSRHFRHLVEQVQQKLSGWKQHVLSRAARLILIQAVIRTIPTYTMNSCKLSGLTVRQLEQTGRYFFLGDRQGCRGIHPIAWDTICTPKVEGGLVLRRLTEKNQVLLAKTALEAGQECEKPMGEGSYRKIWPSNGGRYGEKIAGLICFMEEDHEWL